MATNHFSINVGTFDPRIQVQAPIAKAAPSELVRICASDGTVHRVSRASLGSCKYFEARLARWETDVLEVDADDVSLRVILTLLRYGPGGVPSLEEPLRTMVLKDADYLEVPPPLWAHLKGPSPEEQAAQEASAVKAQRARKASAEQARHQARTNWEHSPAARLQECSKCRQAGCRTLWQCVSCDGLVDDGSTFNLQNSRHQVLTRAHECTVCGIDYVRRVDFCLLCDYGRPKGRPPLTRIRREPL
jgi:hypothetical protein